MTPAPTTGNVFQHLRRMLIAHDAQGVSDTELLRAFCDHRDEAAFSALVRRHGPLVLGVSRRLLRDANDAEDAFQATFIVLIRKARSLTRPERLSNWLYGVAYRTALKARSRAARRRSQEKPLPEDLVADPFPDLLWQELGPVFEEELHRLPDKLRAPVVLCYLQGNTKSQAARCLGWPEGTLSTRLHQARLLLQPRLRRRGWALSTSLVAAALGQSSASASPVPSLLLAQTVSSAFPSAVAGGVSVKVAALSQGVLRAMFLNKLKNVAAAVLLLVGLSLGGGLMVLGHDGPEDKQIKKGANDKPAPAAKAKPDQELIQGTWKVVDAEMGGRKWDVPFLTCTFKGDRIVEDSPKLFIEGTYKLDTTRNPKWIDLTMGEFAPWQQKWIYQFDGERLLLGFPNGIQGPRPTELFANKKPFTFSCRLERVTKEAKGADPDAPKYSEARRRCAYYLRQLGNAMHAYVDRHGHYPMPAIYSKDGKPLLSWRVALLPHIGQEKLYEEFKLDEPWDSAHNKKLLARIPKIYAPMGPAPKDATATYYQVFVGNGALFEERKKFTYRDVADGTVNTILVVEAGEPVPWIKPADLAYDPNKPIPQLGLMLRDGWMTFLTADGSSHTSKNVVDQGLLHAAITRSGGEVIDFSKFDR